MRVANVYTRMKLYRMPISLTCSERFNGSCDRTSSIF